MDGRTESRTEHTSRNENKMASLTRLNWDFSYSQEEIEEYNSLCDDDLDILLNHSDCEGRMKYHECRKVIRALDRIEFKYPDDWRQDWKEKYYILKDMIRYCAKNRKRLYFG